ncbi:condensation domain-containing protein [Massilia sp. B-10]|nr:condensation domain-containing protein [Massilia sp. B-10]
MDSFLAALQQVVDRHDILRTAVVWEGLEQPVQVVCRSTPLVLEMLPADAGTALVEQLMARIDPRKMRLDVRRAPLMAAYAMQDETSGACHLALLNHHLVCDHVTLDLIIAEIQLLLDGRADQLPPALPVPQLHRPDHGR